MRENSMGYRDLLAYIDDLNNGVSSLATAIEKQIKDHQYTPIAKVGKQCYWSLTSALNKGTGWRLKTVTRFLVPSGRETTDHSLVYQVLIDSGSAFDFPTVLCARVTHPPMSQGQVYDTVWKSSRFATLHTLHPKWKNFAEEDGWGLAEASFESLNIKIKGYLLNLLNVNSVSLVGDKIVGPLLHSGDSGWPLSIGQLSFPGFRLPEGETSRAAAGPICT